jgi:DNA-binding response OmpR family regulator
VHVGNVRRKLQRAAGENLIQTVRGVGFCLRKAEVGDEVPDARAS